MNRSEEESGTWHPQGMQLHFLSLLKVGRLLLGDHQVTPNLISPVYPTNIDGFFFECCLLRSAPGHCCLSQNLQGGEATLSLPLFKITFGPPI
jgi:hypothetical protein